MTNNTSEFCLAYTINCYYLTIDYSLYVLIVHQTPPEVYQLMNN